MSTLKEIRDAIIADLDLDDEDFINKSDLNRWINDGIAKAERTILSLYEDYFLTDANDGDGIAISQGQQYVDYPSDIYANKIRKIIYKDGLSNSTSTHVVKKAKNLVDAIERDIYATDTATPILTWLPYNSTANGRKIRLFPKTGRDGVLIVFYIRNAKRLVNDTDQCDIDEFEEFVIRYAKLFATLKDGDIRADDYDTLLKQIEQELIDTLSDMTPTGETEIELDTDHYDDSVGGSC